jgi:hypothetical protein
MIVGLVASNVGASFRFLPSAGAIQRPTVVLRDVVVRNKADSALYPARQPSQPSPNHASPARVSASITPGRARRSLLPIIALPQPIFSSDARH